MRLYGHDIALTTEGPEEGAPVVFLHSSGMSSRQWRHYARVLGDRGWRALAPDLIGCGRSEPWRGSGPFHYLADLRMADELIRRLERPCVLVGHSYGAFLALQLASALGARVERLAIWEPVAWGVLYEHEGGEAFHREQVERGFFDDDRGGSEGWMQAFVEWWSGPGAWEAIGERGRAQMMRSARKTFEEVRSIGEDQTSATHYATIASQTLLMNGTESPAPAREVCDRLAEVIPEVERLELEAGHLAPMNAIPKVAPALFDWLGEDSPR